MEPGLSNFDITLDTWRSIIRARAGGSRGSRRVFVVGCPSRSSCFRPSPTPVYRSYFRNTASIGPPEGGLARHIAQLLQASGYLERSQRARLDRVLVDWERSWLFPAPTLQSRNGLLQLVDWLLNRRYKSESHSFYNHLVEAHHHEAVARRFTQGSRLWFANWQRHALAALRLGLSPRALMALLRSTPVRRAPRAAPKTPTRSPDAESPRLGERLENVIFPNAPGTASPLRYLAAGDGLATTPS